MNLLMNIGLSGVAIMNDEYDYDTGYFEALRNVVIMFMRMPDKEQFFEQLNQELKEAKEILNQYIQLGDVNNE